MRVESTDLPGVHVLRPEVSEDERGRFVRTFDAGELRAAGLPWQVEQMSVSSNTARHTLRGLHYQRGAHAENKVVRCSRGSVWDVVADVRHGSTSFGRWLAFELSATSAVSVVVPAGCAHGFLTLEPDSEVSYAMDTPYVAGAAAGVRYDDPDLAIPWPFSPVLISQRDLALPTLHAEGRHAGR